jgi:hypothetical protein
MLRRTIPGGRQGRVTVLLVAGLLALNGCRATQPSDSATVPPRPHGTTPTPVAAGRTQATKVLVVIEENHSYSQMRRGMPYLARLSDTYGYATNWRAVAHPSEPNYLAIAGGTTFGISDDAPPSAHRRRIGSALSVFDQALAIRRTASTYAQSMPRNCYPRDYSRGRARYAVRHNPWTYFPRSRARCRAHDVPLRTFAPDARRNALPNVGFLIPDVAHDAHDGSLSTADRWLRRKLAPVLRSSDFRSGRLVVIVTADEDDRTSGNRVLTSVLTPTVSRKVVRTRLTHYSLTRYIAQVLGVRPLRHAATAPDLGAAFGL